MHSFHVRTRFSATMIAAATAALVLAASCDKDSGPAATAPSGAKTAADGGAENPATPAGDGASAKSGGGEKVKVVQGAPAGGDDRYALHVEPPSEAKAGQEGEVMVRVVPKDPWHMNLDYPTSLQVAAPAGVTLVKADLEKSDAKKLDESACEFAVKFTPTAAGEQSFTGKFKFAVCQDEACAPVTEDLEFKVAVK